jgi:hypothetical protein
MAWTAPPPVELTEPVSLVGPDGRLNPAARGWARQPLFRTALPGPFLRRKRWNFVFVSHPEVLVAAALSHADYSGLAFVWLYDLKRRRFLELEHLAPLGIGVRLGDNAFADAAFESRALSYRWNYSPTEKAIEVAVNAPGMKGSSAPLSLRLRIPRRDEDESLNLVVPWSDTRFNCTGKLVALGAEGELCAGGERYELGPSDTLASIDCTRGVWPYHIHWRWANGAGYTAPDAKGRRRRFGVNLGAGWSESAGVLENALYIDGRVVPLWEPVDFSLDLQRLEAPWTMRTPQSDRLSLTFTPRFSRTQDTNLLVVRMKLEQVMGHFSGQVRTGDGELLQIDNIPGIAENHMARW